MNSVNDHVKDICKIGQAEKCCRYLVAGGDGLECAKLTDMAETINKRVIAGTFTSMGDNCLGINSEKSLKILNK